MSGSTPARRMAPSTLHARSHSPQRENAPIRELYAKRSAATPSDSISENNSTALVGAPAAVQALINVVYVFTVGMIPLDCICVRSWVACRHSPAYTHTLHILQAQATEYIHTLINCDPEGLMWSLLHTKHSEQGTNAKRSQTRVHASATTVKCKPKWKEEVYLAMSCHQQPKCLSVY